MIDYTPKKKKTEQKFSSKYIKSPKKIDPITSGYLVRETRKIPSRVTSGGSTAPKEFIPYTGDEMIGITIIHKSCLQPVFRKEDAVAAASMRR
jgi:hypothetical protein